MLRDFQFEEGREKERMTMKGQSCGRSTSLGGSIGINLGKRSAFQSLR
jgi:hypothetical protein